jgi:hypothetical protein
MEVCLFATLAGCPAINVPVGFNQDGLPMSMQSLAGTTWIWRSRNLAILMSKQHNG